jgi:hypothetical protein
MPIELTAGGEGTASADAYASSAEHLFDELRRLTLRLEFQVFQQRSRQPSNTLEGLKGVVLCEGEINDILATTANLWDREADPLGDDPDSQSFVDALGRLEAHIQARREVTARAGVPLPLSHLAELFGLSPMEEQRLLVALAPELEPAIGTVYAYLQDDVTRRRPGVDFILGLLVSSLPEHWSARALFGPRASLRRHRLIALSGAGDPSSDSIPLSARTVRAEDRIVDFLVGVDSIDERLATSVVPVALGKTVGADGAWEELENHLRAFLAPTIQGVGVDGRHALVSLWGPDGAGGRSRIGPERGPGGRE